MLFEKNYKTLCERGKTRKGQWKPGSGLERHRILPEHQGGIYVDSNCTYLTLREHAIAHYLLWRINGNVGDQLASRWMRNLKPECYPSRLGIKHSERSKEKMSQKQSGKLKSEEHKKKISESLKEMWNIGKKRSRILGEENPRAKEVKVTYHQIEKNYNCLKYVLKDYPHIPYSTLTDLAQGKYKKSKKYPDLKIEYV